MPEGAAWPGVYASEPRGDIHIVVTDRRADGAWRAPDGAYGELWGEITGNEIRYVWRERRRDERGYPIPWFGRGYFVYEPGDRIRGEWGLQYDESGERLTAVKRLGTPPDLLAVRSTNAEGYENDYDDDAAGACMTGCDGEEEY
jgi:hypothetical protein